MHLCEASSSIVRHLVRNKCSNYGAFIIFSVNDVQSESIIQLIDLSYAIDSLNEKHFFQLDQVKVAQLLNQLLDRLKTINGTWLEM